jgi:hypothetical protein
MRTGGSRDPRKDARQPSPRSLFTVLSLTIVISSPPRTTAASSPPLPCAPQAPPRHPNHPHHRSDNAAPTTQPIVALTPTTLPSTRPIVIDLPPPPVITTPLAEARAKLLTDPLATRRILNDELLAGHLNPAPSDEARDLLAKANEQLIFSPPPFRDDPRQRLHHPKRRSPAQNRRCLQHHPRFAHAHQQHQADARRIRPGQQIKVIHGPFHAVVSKSRFTIDLYLGAPGGPARPSSPAIASASARMTPRPLAHGRPEQAEESGLLQPPRRRHHRRRRPEKSPGRILDRPAGIDGSARRQEQLRHPRHHRPHFSIGREESMGCIRMRNEDVAVVFELLVEGKSTIIVRE